MKNQKKPRRLRLSRETLRQLDAATLSAAVGASYFCDTNYRETSFWSYCDEGCN